MVRADFDQFDRKDVARLLALAEAQRRYYHDIVDLLPAPVAILAADRTVVWTNRAFRQTFGLRADEIRSKPLDQILKLMPATTEIPLRRWDDEDEIETLVFVEQGEQPAKPSQVTLAAARADALYNFAGQVAHDLNNPLMIVTGYAEELLEILPPNDPQRKNINEILSAAARMSGLGAQLVDIATRHARPAGPVNVADVVTSAKAKIAGARVTTGPSQLEALADAGQLAEVILAIASGRPKIAISWSLEGRFARITMQTEGPAIDEDRRAAIFDPVLTKTVDAAAGMPLARAYSIVREWGGDITFSGTAFSIYLPRLARADSGETTPETGGESILIVEDETEIRGLIVKILRREGYQVSEAARGEEIPVSANLRLLITDVKLSGMSGPDLARKLHTTTPGLKVLYISGYTDDPTARSATYPPGARFLAKPFTLSALIAKVRETLGTY